MSIPKVAIVGRPNVGKSSLFNWLVGKRIAIVDSMAGVTRDRMTYLMEIEEERFIELIDTGGMGIEDPDKLTDDVERQIQLAIDQADLILFVVDIQTGMASLDNFSAERLRRANVPVVLVANKADNNKLAMEAYDFETFGYSIIPTSCTHNQGRNELLAYILENIPTQEELSQAEQVATMREEMKVALIGRRNVGKSTFINSLVGDERMIVSEVPGTTRDSVDIRFELDGLPLLAIDTPGFRRGKSVKKNVDFFGIHRSKRSIRRADVTLLFFDATQQISKVEKQLCHYIAENCKPCVFVVNKWDLLVGETATEGWADYLYDTFPMMEHVPIAFITGKTGKNIERLLRHTRMVFKQTQCRVPTPALNEVVKLALADHPPPRFENRTPKIFYATQVGIEPPTFVFFTNKPKGFAADYQRYLQSVFRDEFDVAEVPMRFYFRQKDSHVGRDG